MQKRLLNEAEAYAKRNHRRQVWRKLVRMMACVVVFCTTYALILPAITMERSQCELEEHIHSESCYAKVTTRQQQTLSCTYDSLSVHQHTPECRDGEGALICGYGDYLVHEHDAACTDEAGILVCQLPVVKAHTHTEEDCFAPVEMETEHIHDDTCYTLQRGELLCQIEETPGHAHGDECYTLGELQCQLEEREGHTHTETCTEKILLCDLTVEPHVHTDACYRQLTCDLSTEPAHTHTDACTGRTLTCTSEEEGHEHTDACYLQLTCDLSTEPLHTHTDACTGRVLDCQQTEQPHIHTDECYQVNDLCGQEEQEGHTHTRACYASELTCEAEETEGHAHTDECYEQLRAQICDPVPAEPELELICEKPEVVLHTHADACYETYLDEAGAEQRRLICPELEVRTHTHGESCYITQEIPMEDVDTLTCQVEEAHRHTEQCYDETGALACQHPEDHTHGERCYGTWELICGKEEHTHTEACKQIPEYICGQEEHTHTEECMDAEGNLICELAEHIHSEGCEAEPAPTYYCGLEAHTHAEECMDAEGNLICELAEHTHSEECEDALLHIDSLIFPPCDCDVTSYDLEKHTDECVRKIFCKKIVEEYSVIDLYTDWNRFEDDAKAYILSDLNDTDKKAYHQLDQLLNGEPNRFELPNGMIVMIDGIPEGGRLFVTEIEDNTQSEVLGSIGSVNTNKNATINDTAELEIKVLLNGTEWQPEGNGFVTVTLSGGGIKNLVADRVAINHVFDDESGIAAAFEQGCVLSYSESGLSAVYPEETDAVESVMGQQDTIYFEEFYHDGDRINVNKDGTLSFRLYSFSTIKITGYSVNSASNLPTVAALPDTTTGISVDKYVEHIEGENYRLVLEAYSRGYTEFTPTDVVFIMDQSCSMYSPVEPDAELRSGQGSVNYSIMTYDQLMSLDMSDPSNLKAGMEGYYVAVFRKNTSAANVYHAIPLKYDGGWKRTQGDGSTAKNKWVSETITEVWYNQWMDLTPTWENNEEFTIYKSVYGAAYDAMYSFTDEMARSDVQDCYAAIVAFSCPSQSYSAGPMNTGVFVNGTLIEGIGSGISAETYRSAFNDMSSTDGITAFRNSIDAIRTSGQTTTTDAGFDLANRALSNWDPTPDTQRQSIVILFTDGVPENRISGSNNYTAAIAMAKTTKQTASVYAFGPTAGGQPLDFLMALSSSYPNATSLDNLGSYSGNQYYGTASSSADLQRAFSAIAKEITQSSANLDASAVLRDIITDEFVLPEGTTVSDIHVYTAPWNGTAFGQETAVDLPVTISGQIVNVSGYDYSAESNWVINGKSGGNKLIVKIPITVSPDYDGGNHVQTNTTDTAIYTSDGKPEEYFPLPYVDVPTDVIIKKVLTGNAADKESMKFDFSSTYKKWNGYNSVEGTVVGDSNYLQTIQASETKPFELGHEETITLQQIHVGSTFTVSETILPGYTTSVSINGGEPIYLGENGTVTINSLQPGTVIVFTNHADYELPNTGGAGTYLYTTGGLLIMAAAILLYIHNQRRRKEETPSF